MNNIYFISLHAKDTGISLCFIIFNLVEFHIADKEIT